MMFKPGTLVKIKHISPVLYQFQGRVAEVIRQVQGEPYPAYDVKCGEDPLFLFENELEEI